MIRDVWQRLGTSGDPTGTSGNARRSFLYGYAINAVVAAAVNVLNVITWRHEAPRLGLWPPIVWEGTSWLGLMAFFWIPWLAYRFAPPTVRPRRRLLIHPAAALLYSLGHVGGFVALRKLIFGLSGLPYDFGPAVPGFLYEFGKDAIGYTLFIGTFALIERLRRPQVALGAPRPLETFDIRDGAKLTRVPVERILAVTSAKNYVEFALDDGRRLLMRAPLSAIEAELAPHGFVRTHRSWLINPRRLTALRPEGSGDYVVELGSLSAPLSRRFPEALARLREPTFR